MDFLAVYGEAGMIGVVGAMFVYLVVHLCRYLYDYLYISKTHMDINIYTNAAKLLILLSNNMTKLIK